MGPPSVIFVSSGSKELKTSRQLAASTLTVVGPDSEEPGQTRQRLLTGRYFAAISLPSRQNP